MEPSDPSHPKPEHPNATACRIFMLVSGVVILILGAVVAALMLGDSEKGAGHLLRSVETPAPTTYASPSLSPTQHHQPTTTPSFAPSTNAPTQYRYPFDQCSINATACCNGLENLCDWRVDQVMFGVVHNAMSSKQDGFYLPNNWFPLEDALDAGYRGLSLDVCHCNGEYVLCHGFCGLGERNPTQVFTNLVTFLNEHPTDSIVVTLELNGDAGRPVDLVEFYDTVLVNVEGLDQLLYQHENRDDDWPTLGTMVETNQRLLMFHYNGPQQCDDETQDYGGCPRGLHYYFDYAMETGFEFTSVENLQDVANACQIQRGRESSTGTFFGVNNFVTVLNSADMQAASLQVNQKEFLYSRIAECAESALTDKYNPGQQADVNFLFVDFWNLGDVVEVVQTHNQHLGWSRSSGRNGRGS